MLIYDLVCDNGHDFEGWFKNSEELAEQSASGLLTCPFCDSEQISKKLAAPKLTRKSNTAPADGRPANIADHSQYGSEGSESSAKIAQGMQEILAAANSESEKFAELQKMLGKVHDFIDDNFEDVGNRFADEAISIHRGDKDPANIRGRASREELGQLAEEGVDAVALPPRPIDYKKIN